MSKPFNTESFDTKWIEDPITSCWEWQATKNQDGYGRVWCDVSVGLVNAVRAGHRWKHLIDKYESNTGQI